MEASVPRADLNMLNTAEYNQFSAWLGTSESLFDITEGLLSSGLLDWVMHLNLIFNRQSIALPSWNLFCIIHSLRIFFKSWFSARTCTVKLLKYVCAYFARLET